MNYDISTITPYEVPFFGDICNLLANLKTDIHDDMRATDDPDDTEPGMCVTIASDENFDDWAFQTGDNSFSGACYHFPHWGVIYLYPDSDVIEAAKDGIEEILEAISQTI